MSFDAIVFDFDGVLVESVDVKTQAFAALYSPYGTDVVRLVVGWHLAHGGVSRFQKFRHFHSEFLRRELGEVEEQELGRRFSQLVEDAVVASAWVPGALEFLEVHHLRLPLYVASGTPHDELQRIVLRRGMAGYFRSVFGSPASKGEILSSILSATGYSPQRVLMVGDATTDYEGALQAGTAFVGRVPEGAQNPFPPETPILTTLESLTALCT
jgi:phosphoglycolate phosphatase-like HAD superfamily hydrolase